MIKVTVLYPNAADAKFDMKYYVTHHMPMVRDKCGPACRSIAAEGGVAGGDPGSKAPYIAPVMVLVVKMITPLSPAPR